MKIIQIPKEFTYLSDIPEFKDGLPFNCVIDKQVTRMWRNTFSINK